MNISTHFFLLYFVMLAWIVIGKVKIDVRRATLYFLTMSLFYISCLVNTSSAAGFSVPSIIYLMLVYLPLIFVRRDSRKFRQFLVSYQWAMIVGCIAGLAQFVLQHIGVPYKDYLADIVPEMFLKRGYVTSYGIEWNSDFFKSNGVFFLEASYFSKHAAVSILIELLFLKRIYLLAIFVPALLVSFSGTGIAVLAFASPLLLMKLPVRYTLALVMLAVMSLSVMGATGKLDHLVRRSTEFSDPTSSGYSRFVSPYIHYSAFTNTENVWFGNGPGFASLYEDQDPYGTRHFYSVSYAKVGMEYGIFALALFTGFALYNFFGRTTSVVLSAGMFFEYYVFVGGLMGAENILLFFSLLMLFPDGWKYVNDVLPTTKGAK